MSLEFESLPYTLWACCLLMEWLHVQFDFGALPRQGCHADNNGRTDDRTMAAGPPVTWTHCSIRYEVT
jgi:hypothetical protein